MDPRTKESADMFDRDDCLYVRTDGRDRAAEFFGFDPKATRVEPHAVDDEGIIWSVWPPLETRKPA